MKNRIAVIGSGMAGLAAGWIEQPFPEKRIRTVLICKFLEG